MSVTAQARPFQLISDFVQVINSLHEGANTETENFIDINSNVEQILAKNQYNITADVQEEIIHTICKEYKTVFVNQDVLIKTLEEHGFYDIEVANDHITCAKNFFKLEFYRNNSVSDNQEQEPYVMKITTNCHEEDIIDLINDINSEYTLNSQEENYIKIKERLAKKGLKINEEEVFEDDTIVLTVNME